MNYCINTGFLLSILISVFPVANVFATNVHVYTVDTPVLRVYQKDVPLSRQQKHIALIHVADIIKKGSSVDLNEFAKIALKEMAYSYEEEAIKTNSETAVELEHRNKLYRWAMSTMEYAEYLHFVSDSINDQSIIEIETDKNGELLIIVNDRPFFIISPSLHEPEILDQKIIDIVCQSRDCQLQSIGFKDEPGTRTIIVEADWHLTDRSRPEFVTADGLHFIFNDIKNRIDKQNACLRIIRELRVISDLLTQANEDGLYIDWNYIHVKKVGENKRYKLIFNQAGESLLVEAAELAKLPELAGNISSWLKAKVYKKHYHQYIEADKLLAGLIE